MTPTLRFPPVCPVTGEPTVGTVRLLFRRAHTAYLIGNLANSSVSVQVPVSNRTRRYLRRRRRGLAVVGLGSVVVGLVGAAVGTRSESVGLAIAGVASLGIVAFLVLAFVATVQLDLLSSDVDGEWVILHRVHPAFVEAFLAANPPGVVQVLDRPPLPRLSLG